MMPTFFLKLVPGRPDRFGVPPAIRFWQHAIERCEDPNVCRTLVLYGPSGSGKSSLVKAGLLPRLNLDIHHIYIECGSADVVAELRQQPSRRF